jgi:DNA-binding response OmpR family regulator
VLIVDDDATIREILAIALSEAGYAVLQAENGAEALALVRDPDHVAVVLLDWMMPILDGAGFAAGLRTLPDHVPQPAIVVVAATAARERAAKIGAAAAFGKPFLLAELLACVSTLIEGAPTETETETETEAAESAETARPPEPPS